MQAVSRIQMNGVPFDGEALAQLQAQWDRHSGPADCRHWIATTRCMKAAPSRPTEWEHYLVANEYSVAAAGLPVARHA